MCVTPPYATDMKQLEKDGFKLLQGYNLGVRLYYKQEGEEFRLALVHEGGVCAGINLRLYAKDVQVLMEKHGVIDVLIGPKIGAEDMKSAAIKEYMDRKWNKK